MEHRDECLNLRRLPGFRLHPNRRLRLVVVLADSRLPVARRGDQDARTGKCRTDRPQSFLLFARHPSDAQTADDALVLSGTSLPAPSNRTGLCRSGTSSLQLTKLQLYLSRS